MGSEGWFLRGSQSGKPLRFYILLQWITMLNLAMAAGQKGNDGSPDVMNVVHLGPRPSMLRSCTGTYVTALGETKKKETATDRFVQISCLRWLTGLFHFCFVAVSESPRAVPLRNSSILWACLLLPGWFSDGVLPRLPLLTSLSVPLTLSSGEVFTDIPVVKLNSKKNKGSFFFFFFFFCFWRSELCNYRAVFTLTLLTLLLLHTSPPASLMQSDKASKRGELSSLYRFSQLEGRHSSWPGVHAGSGAENTPRSLWSVQGALQPWPGGPLLPHAASHCFSLALVGRCKHQWAIWKQSRQW